MRIVKGIFKWLFLGILIFIIGFLIVRIMLQNYYPSEMKKLSVTPAAAAAYNADPEGFNVLTIEPDSAYDSSGILFVRSVMYIESAGELQLSVRFNDSVLKAIAAEYSLDEAPDGRSPYLTFVLRDADGNRCDGTIVAERDILFYNYRRLSFALPDGLDTSSGSDAVLYLDFYYSGTEEGSEKPLVTLTVFDSGAKTRMYSLPSSVKSALSKYGN